MMPREVDCLILGGGITGAGVARDAAMRGLRVLLADSDDFASGTSHLTSKLIHGGLRYLEHGHVRLVVEGIIERDRLLNRIAPNLVHPVKFVMPFEGQQFAKWLATVCSLQLYGLTEWYRTGRWSGGILAPGLRKDYPIMRAHPFSISFWDAQTNDARLVLATLRTAACGGATLWNYTSLSRACFERGAWVVDLRSDAHEVDRTVRARTIVNATGPWSPMTAEMLGGRRMNLMWIKGSHILLRRPACFGDDAIVIRSVRNQRPLWAVPWNSRLLVGSTESRYTGELRLPRPTAEEVDDLFDSFVSYFPALGTTRKDICCACAGVRPIVAQSVEAENSLSRHHRIDVDGGRNLITITGGKLTTFRLMAEQTVDAVDRLLGRRRTPHELRRRLRGDPLWPGLTPARAGKLRARLAGESGNGRIDPSLIDHLVRHYGHDAEPILADMARHPQLGEPICEGLPYTLAELGYLSRAEKVCHLLDLVKRRTPLYFLSDDSDFESLPRIVDHVAPLLGWGPQRRTDELARVADEFRADMRAVGNGPIPRSTCSPSGSCLR